MQTTLLTEEQIWGNNALEIMNNYGAKTPISDLALVLGGYRSGGETTLEGEYTGFPWSASATSIKDVRVVSRDGNKNY